MSAMPPDPARLRREAQVLRLREALDDAGNTREAAQRAVWMARGSRLSNCSWSRRRGKGLRGRMAELDGCLGAEHAGPRLQMLTWHACPLAGAMRTPAGRRVPGTA
jgi:hypothetical protein